MNTCPGLDDCWQVKRLMDNDWPGEVLAQAIRETCGRCELEQLKRAIIPVSDDPEERKAAGWVRE